MTKRTGPTNNQLQTLIVKLKEKAIKDNTGLWKRIAVDLEKPSRQKRIVNLSRLDIFCKNDELVIVPGKVLGDGELNKKLNIAAFAFSKSAKEKISKSESKMMSIEELINKGIKTSDIRIIG